MSNALFLIFVVLLVFGVPVGEQIARYRQIQAGKEPTARWF